MTHVACRIIIIVVAATPAYPIWKSKVGAGERGVLHSRLRGLEEALRHTDPGVSRVRDAWDFHRDDMYSLGHDWNRAFDNRAKALLALYLVPYRPSATGGDDEDGPPPKDPKKDPDPDPDDDQDKAWREYNNKRHHQGSGGIGGSIIDRLARPGGTKRHRGTMGDGSINFWDYRLGMQVEKGLSKVHRTRAALRLWACRLPKMILVGSLLPVLADAGPISLYSSSHTVAGVGSLGSFFTVAWYVAGTFIGLTTLHAVPKVADNLVAQIDEVVIHVALETENFVSEVVDRSI